MVASSPFLCPSRLRRSLTRSRETRFTRPNRRACLQARGLLCDCPITLPNCKLTSHWTISVKVNTLPVAAMSTPELFCAWRPGREASSLLAESEAYALGSRMLWPLSQCLQYIMGKGFEVFRKSSEHLRAFSATFGSIQKTVGYVRKFQSRQDENQLTHLTPK